MKEYTKDQFSPFKINIRFEKAVRRGSSNVVFLSYLFHSSICNYLYEGKLVSFCGFNRSLLSTKSCFIRDRQFPLYTAPSRRD